MDLQSTALPLSQLAGLSRIGVDAEGLEPTTKGLKGPCSTIELRQLFVLRRVVETRLPG